MLIQRHRFHGRNSLRTVYQHGQTVRGPLLGLKYNKRDPSKPFRVAVVVSRKVSKSAVVRNRIRRRIFELVRTAAPQPKPGTDLVFTVYGEAVATTESDKLKQTIGKLLQQANS